ncbi:TraX family protein [Paenibacillus segetis]|uniref:Fimbrial assembly protein fimC n=1 Tax=Paenibacillus segetis TaxID=1325360 RepID=A0ABQ1Y7I1_9BACL|nr:TraX family protein [Paenibacillus segetis]GGH15588.1 fimbrial assembly protein fimC [Paenibacillus segetis]
MQIIAMLTMLIDHVGLLFFPDQVLWRMIGRIAFPLYAYALVQGYLHTSSYPKYVFRLFCIAALSQIPYQLAFGTNGLNVVASFLIAMFLLRLLRAIPSGVVSTLLIATVCIFLEVFPFEYGAYGLLLVLIFRYARSHQILIMHLLLNLTYLLVYGWVIQMFSIIPTILIAYGPGVWRRLESRTLPGWIWRFFYPVHLAALVIIGYFIGK